MNQQHLDLSFTHFYFHKMIRLVDEISVILHNGVIAQSTRIC